MSADTDNLFVYEGRIMGIDPGPDYAAAVILDGAKVISADKIKCREVSAACEHHKVDIVAIERAGHMGKASRMVKQVIQTLIMCGWMARDIESVCSEIVWIERHLIKQALLGRVTGTDADIRQAIIRRYGGRKVALGKKAFPGPLWHLQGKGGHLWQAMGVAITAIEMEGEPMKVPGLRIASTP